MKSRPTRRERVIDDYSVCWLARTLYSDRWVNATSNTFSVLHSKRIPLRLDIVSGIASQP